jgi:ribosomal protein S18 acetylase RimI-like enzyme
MRKEISQLLPGGERKAQALSRRVWSHEASREAGRTVEYPARSVRIFRAYLTDPSMVALGAFDGRRLIGQCFGHLWGSEGWIGPIEVDHRHRGMGIASDLLRRTEDTLDAMGAEVLGLEAAADRSDILEYYKRRGYGEVGRTIYYQKRLCPSRGKLPPMGPMPEASLVRDSGMDCTAEMRMARDHGLGRVIGDGFVSSSVVYLHPLRGVPISALRVVLARTEEDLADAISKAEAVAASSGSDMLFFNARAYEETHELFASMGYQARGVNATLVKKGRRGPHCRYCIAPWAG